MNNTVAKTIINFEGDSTNYIGLTRGLKLYKAMYNSTIKHYNDDPPIDSEIVTCSDPIDSDLHSSSTFTVSIIKAYIKFLSLPLGSYYISDLACKIERDYFGIKGKRQDCYSTIFDDFNFIEFQKADKTIINLLTIEKSIILELERRLVLFDTGASLESNNATKEKNSQNPQNKVDSLLKTKQRAVNIKKHHLKSNFRSVMVSVTKGWQLGEEASKSVIHSCVNKVYKIIINVGSSTRVRILQILSGEKTGQVYHPHFIEEGLRNWIIGDNNE